jgi:hypothetical protein
VNTLATGALHLQLEQLVLLQNLLHLICTMSVLNNFCLTTLMCTRQG